VRIVALALTVFVLEASNGLTHAKGSKGLFQDKFEIAEIFEAADFASSKCLGLHLIEEAVTATAIDLGFSEEDDDIIHSPEFNFWAERGRTNAKIGYEKNPIKWCEDMWRFLGPDHPPMIKHTLLTKD
jgi:hypothetical protein